MHFRIDKNENIVDFHIEEWDREALGEELCQKIYSFRDKPLKEFLVFALVNRIYAYTSILYYINESNVAENVYFWAYPGVWNQNEEFSKSWKETQNRLSTSFNRKMDYQYAIINVRVKGLDPKLTKNSPVDAMVINERAISRAIKLEGGKSKEFDLEVAKDCPEFGKDFNIIRNYFFGNTLFVKKEKRKKETDNYMMAAIPGIRIIGQRAGFIFYFEVFTPEQIKKVTSKELIYFSNFYATPPKDEAEKKECEEVFAHLDKIKKEISEKVPPNLPEKPKKPGLKSYFSHLFRKAD